MITATVVSTFGISIVVAVSWIHHHNPTRKVPKYIKGFFIRFIGTRCCCMKFKKGQNSSKVNNHKLYTICV